MRHFQAQRGASVTQSRCKESLGAIRHFTEPLLILVSPFPTGRENHLQVSLQKSVPTAICYGIMLPSLRSSCANIVDTMPYDRYKNLFGPSDDPRVTVELPLTLTSGTFILCLNTVFAVLPPTPRESLHVHHSKVEIILTPPIADHLCQMTISTSGPSDQAKWYDIWQAAMQLNQICVRSGKKGSNPGLGAKLKLSIDVSQPQPESGSGGLNNGTAVTAEGLYNGTAVTGEGLNNGTIESGEGQGFLNNSTVDSAVGDASTS